MRRREADLAIRLFRPTEPELVAQRIVERLQELGLDLSEARFPVRCASLLVGWELVRSGQGVGMMTTIVGDATPGVERAMPSLPVVPAPLWLVAHHELRTSRRLRVVFDFLAGELAAL